MIFNIPFGGGVGGGGNVAVVFLCLSFLFCLVLT